MGAQQTGQDPITDINVTPLVDVCLVLVIIFMVISPLVLQAGIEVAPSRPDAKKGETALKENVRVVLKDDGSLFVNGLSVSWNDLGNSIRKALVKSKDKLVSINASENSTVGQVVELLDRSKQSGAQRLAILNP